MYDNNQTLREVYREDIKYWELWDQKELFMKKHSRSKAREEDRIRSLDRGAVGNHRSRSRSRGRSRIDDNFRDILRDRSRERSRDRSRDRDGNNDDDKKRKEQVKWW